MVNGWAHFSLQNEFNLEHTDPSREMLLFDLKIGGSSDFLPPDEEDYFSILVW